MLQPAQITPASAVEPVSPPTYGALMASAREAVAHALVLGAGRLPDAETGAVELAGYARFLRYAGTHLHTLFRLGELRNDHTSRLVQQLNRVHETEPTGGRWLHAASLLGAAHDVLATHLTGVGVPRTPEADELLAAPATVAACREVTGLIVAAVDGSGELLRRTAQAQQGRPDKPVSAETFRHFHARNQIASLCARAALWDLDQLMSQGSRGRLDQLRPSLQLNARQPPPFSTSIAALRLLRHYSYAQARGLTVASPASLRDMALLGVRVTNSDATAHDLHSPSTALDRIRHAHFADQLTEAHAAWGSASTGLTNTVRGLTKAPADYAAAIKVLLDAPLTPGLRRALGTALPRMGVEAAVTIQRLGDRAELVTLQRPPLRTRHEWRPITPEHTAALVEQFNTAARTTRHAYATIASERAAPRYDARPPRERVFLERQRQAAR